MKQQKKQAGVSVFYSYAHEDELLQEQLQKHLIMLRRQGLISEWHDREIIAGAEWAKEIDAQLETASVILLLVSSAFLASDYCFDIEMQRALERHARKDTCVIPIILRPCEWQEAPFAHIQILPSNGVPVTEWSNPDAAFLNIVGGLRRAIEQRILPDPPLLSLSSIDRQNRIRLLRRVRANWIEGLLEQSLHQVAWIDLHLQEQPDALENPWRLVVQELGQTPRPLPIGTHIVEVFDGAGGELLLLGEPGAGKTTLLLELARILLDRAEQNERLPMPIVFNLASWAEQRQSLRAWLVEELQTKYQVPRKIGQAWIDAGQVLPLLDGLDEVIREARSSCVQQINDYCQLRLEHGSCQIVVCCRREEYAMLPTGAKLQCAVTILPLTDEQISTYLEQAGEQVKALRQALSEDAELHNLARQPLMLNVFTLAYQGATVAEVPTGKTREEMQDIVFAMYVEHMLLRRKPSERWSPKQVIGGLSFQAKQMQQHNQTVFLVENLQPTWLSGKGRLLYQSSVGLVRMLAFGIASVLIAWLLGGFIGMSGIGQAHLLVRGLVGGLSFGLFVGPIGELMKVLMRRLDTNIHPAKAFTLFWDKLLLGLGVGLIVALGVGLAIGLVGWSVAGLRRGIVAGLIFGLVGGLVSGSIFGLIAGLSGGMVDSLVGGLFRTLTDQLDTSIHPAETLTWSWKKALAGVVLGLAIGLVLWLVVELVAKSITKIITEAVIVQAFALIFGVTGVVILGLVFGPSGRQLPKRLSLAPNEGIWRSGKNGLTGALVGGPLAGLGIGLVGGLAKGPIFGVLAALFFGLMGGLGIGLMVGLEAFEKHFLLRFFLSRQGDLPWDLVPFLNEAVERLLLRKAGGSYLFVHRLLLEYFAILDKQTSLESTSSEDETAKSVYKV